MEQPQNLQIFRYLMAGGTLTPLEALNRFQCFSLAQRIHNINEAISPYRVTSEPCKVGDKKVAKYSIDDITRNAVQEMEGKGEITAHWLTGKKAA